MKCQLTSSRSKPIAAVSRRRPVLWDLFISLTEVYMLDIFLFLLFSRCHPQLWISGGKLSGDGLQGSSDCRQGKGGSRAAGTQLVWGLSLRVEGGCVPDLMQHRLGQSHQERERETPPDSFCGSQMPPAETLYDGINVSACSSWRPTSQISSVLGTSLPFPWLARTPSGSALGTGSWHRLRVSVVQSGPAMLISPWWTQRLRSAASSGRVAAFNMLDRPLEMTSVPFFWTVLSKRSIRYVGKFFSGCRIQLVKSLPWNCYGTNEIMHLLTNVQNSIMGFIIMVIFIGHGEGHTEVILKGNVEELKFLAFYIK